MQMIFARVERTGQQGEKVTTGKFVILKSADGEEFFAPLGCRRKPKSTTKGDFCFVEPGGVVYPPPVGTQVAIFETEKPTKKGQNRVAKIWCLLTDCTEVLRQGRS